MTKQYYSDVTQLTGIQSITMTNTITDNKQQINPELLNQQLKQKQVNLVDVREPGEYAGEHIPGATLVPLSHLSPDKLPQDSDRALILYCRSGNRSQQAAQKLTAAGISVQQLQGGIEAWKQAGYATKVNKDAPISIMRQVQIVAGSLVVAGTLLAAFVSPWFLILSGFVGTGLIFAGITDTCAMGMLLAKLPYNQHS